MSIYNMSQIKFKKLTLQYAFLKLEKEEVEDACSGQEKEIQEYLKKHHPKYYEIIPIAEEEPQQEDTENKTEKPDLEEEGLDESPKIENEEEEERTAIPKNKDLRTLYRKIVSKTHPDKIGDEKYAEIFNAAARAYEENNLAKLLEIAGTLNIELTEMCQESVALLKINIKTLVKEVNRMKQSTAWAWANAETKEQKQKIIKFLLNLKGIKT